MEEQFLLKNPKTHRIRQGGTTAGPGRLDKDVAAARQTFKSAFDIASLEELREKTYSSPVRW
jgi:hypothetical protein